MFLKTFVSYRLYQTNFFLTRVRPWGRDEAVDFNSVSYGEAVRPLYFRVKKL